MKTVFLALNLLAGTLLASLSTSLSGAAQSRPAAPSMSVATPWFTLREGELVLTTGTTAKPVTEDVVFPNGSRLEYRTQALLLSGGKRVALQEGDFVNINGDLVKAAAMAAPAPPAATPPAPVPAAAPATVPATVPAFGYKAPAPAGGKLKGVVELGASGFNSFVVRVDKQRRWQLEKSEYSNSLVLENMATDDDIRRGLKTYIGQMLDFGVAGKDIHFVVSSGALLASGTARIVKSLRELKYNVTTVTPEREGDLALRAVLPADYAGKAFVVDMGSGNTKMAWASGATGTTGSTVVNTFGAKYFQQDTDPAVVAADVRAKAGQVPAALRQTCFLIGGVPSDLAKLERQGKERYTVLKLPAAYGTLPGAKLKAGLNIYENVAAATGCQQFVFDWDANFTIGYLLTLP